MTKQTFIISNKEVQQRLDIYLRDKLNFSRSCVQTEIKAENVLVNNKKVTSHYRLKENDKIEVDLENINQVKSIQTCQPVKLDIVFEDSDFLVINKPAGISVHPANENDKEFTLVQGIICHDPKVKEIGEDKNRPGIVHRLDKFTSGVMVIVKNQQAYDHLKKQFQDRSVEKEYLTLVYGKFSQTAGEICFNIERSKTSRGKMAAKPGCTGKQAVTEYEVIKEIKNYTYLKVKPKTGRTHQIRVHLNAIGHPVVGDPIYRPRKLKTKATLNRLFLHASKLSFRDLNNNLLTFKAPLPQVLEDLLKQLEK